MLALSSHRLSGARAAYDIVRKMRASILVLGPLLARIGRAEVSLPGGCAIGARPVDLHLHAMQALGAEIELRDGYVHARAPAGLRGARIAFPQVTVGGTENALLAAVLARGTTLIENAAQEPEIADLAACLAAMGGADRRRGQRPDRGRGRRRAARRHPCGDPRPDRTRDLHAGPAIVGGHVELLGGRRDLVAAFADKLAEAGADIAETTAGLRVARENGGVRAIDVETAPFPGFPTDLQAQMMALLTLADGTSHLHETIFENRFMHAPELGRMGARIVVEGGTATVRGVERLRGAPVMATDLRASVSLILAGLAAEGETVVNRVYHLDRGYESVEQKLSALGAEIARVRAP